VKFRALLFLGGLALIASEIGASESLDAVCRDKLTRELASLEAAFAANRAQFDSQVDAVLTKYAASHPAASKADYKAAFDMMFEERFRKLFTHWNVVSVYKGVLENGDDPQVVCKMSERKLRKGGESLASQDKALYNEIIGEVSRTFR
jgi:hypothetical protein